MWPASPTRPPQIIMQLFNWTRNPSYAATIAQRKDELYDEIMNGVQPAEVPNCRGFLDTLRNYKVRRAPAPPHACMHMTGMHAYACAPASPSTCMHAHGGHVDTCMRLTASAFQLEQ